MTDRKLTTIALATFFAAAALCAEETVETEPILTENIESESDIVGGGTTTTIKYLIHYIERMAKVEKFLIESLIDATDGVSAGITIYGHHNEEQTGDGIVFTDGGEYEGHDIVAGYHIKDLYPEASNSGYINVKTVEVSSPYSGKEAVCGIFHEQAGNGAQQDLGSVSVTDSFKVSYSGANASVAGIWQKGTGTSEPPYFRENVMLNGVEISATGSGAIAYGIIQDGNAHIDGNVELHGRVSSRGGNAFGIKGGIYKGNVLADLSVSATDDTATNGTATGIYLTQTAGSINGALGVDGNTETDSDGNVRKANLVVTASADAVGILLGGETASDGGEPRGGNVAGAFSNYNITATSTSANPENIAVGVYMHNGASVGSMSDLNIYAKSYYGPAAGFVYDNTGAETMSVGASVTRLNITAESFFGAESGFGRVAGIVIGNDTDFTVDASSITIKPADGKNSYGLAYGKDVSGEADESDGGVGVFNHTRKDSSGLNITNSQITAYAYSASSVEPSAYGLYLVGDSSYGMAGNAFTAIASGGNAYGLYAAGTAKVSNLKTLSAQESLYAYGVYLDGSATADATTLAEIKAASNTVGGHAFGIYKASAESAFNNFNGKIILETFSPKDAVYGLYYSDSKPADGVSLAVYNAATNDSSGIELSENVSVEINNKSSDNATYGIYVSGNRTVSAPAVKINVRGSGNGDIYGAYVDTGNLTLAGTISATRDGNGTGKLVGIWAGTGTSVSLADGANIDATGGDALASDGDMTLASLGSAQLTGSVSVAGTLHLTQGAFSLNAGTISAKTWEIGSADVSGNVASAKVSLASDTEFSGTGMIFYVEKPETRSAQNAVISVADGVTLTALATTVSVVLDRNCSYENGDVITLVSGNASFEKIENLEVLQNGAALNPNFYTYGNVAGGWGITFIPEPSAFGLLAGTLALALAGTRRRRRR